MAPSRIALVTGANQGLGRALVEGLAAAGTDDHVLLTGRNAERVAVEADRLGGLGADVHGRVLDVTDTAAVQAAADAITAEYGGIDIVIESVVAGWRAAVHDGSAESRGWPAWLNIPSKVAQVAAVRVVTAGRRARDLTDGTLVAAVCPGLVDTDASRPWFTDMSRAQTPEQAAAALLDIFLAPTVDPA